MLRYFGLIALLGAPLALGQAKDAPKTDGKPTESSQMTATSPLDFTVKDIDGNDVALSKYKGKVVLIVNVASKCGFTPQYRQLQALHDKYADKGLAILAFPSNDFRGQEPGSNAEIKQFCSKEYGVKFDLFEKVAVKGEQSSELYKFLSSAEKNGEYGREIGWNFTKFLIDRDGKVVARFEPRVKPEADEVIKAIEKALEAKKS